MSLAIVMRDKDRNLYIAADRAVEFSGVVNTLPNDLQKLQCFSDPTTSFYVAGVGSLKTILSVFETIGKIQANTDTITHKSQFAPWRWYKEYFYEEIANVIEKDTEHHNELLLVIDRQIIKHTGNNIVMPVEDNFIAIGQGEDFAYGYYQGIMQNNLDNHVQIDLAIGNLFEKASSRYTGISRDYVIYHEWS